MPVGKEAIQIDPTVSCSLDGRTPAPCGIPNGAQADPASSSAGMPAVFLGNSAAGGFTFREEVRKQRELDEARKSGLIPAEKDEEGRDINPHIPQYIAKAPWYLSQDNRPSLKHQRFVGGGHEAGKLQKWYHRGVVASDPAAPPKYRPGACANCGALTHVSKECTDRPRRLGAKWTGQDIQPDEIICDQANVDLELDFEGKRDRYGGYNPANYRWIIEEYSLADVERKKRKAMELQSSVLTATDKKTRKKLKRRLERIGGAAAATDPPESIESAPAEPSLPLSEKQVSGQDSADTELPQPCATDANVAVDVVGDEASEASAAHVTLGDTRKETASPTEDDSDGEPTDEEEEANTSDDDSDSDNEEDAELDDVRVKDFDTTNAPIGMKDTRTRTTTMNLRIREDTAKYLFNLDVDSAFYDPKTRSMRDNPLRHLKEKDQGVFRGDNLVRGSGEADCVRDMEVFAWESHKRDVNVHPQAQPTQLALFHRQHLRDKEELLRLKQRQLLERYQVPNSSLAPPPGVLHSQVETYIEFDPITGRAKNVRGRAMARSKYEEDVSFGDHTAVWGSWFDRASSQWGYACCRGTDRFQFECRPQLHG